MKTDCAHDIHLTSAGTDRNGMVRIELTCSDCGMEFEHYIDESGFIAEIMELDSDPNIYIDGVLQND